MMRIPKQDFDPTGYVFDKHGVMQAAPPEETDIDRLLREASGKVIGEYQQAREDNIRSLIVAGLSREEIIAAMEYWESSKIPNYVGGRSQEIGGLQ